MKMKRIAAAMAAVSMLTAFSAQAVVAADGVTVTAGKATAKAGENFTLTVDLGSVPAAGINGAEFEVTYNADALTITGVSAGDIVNSSATDQEGFADVAVFDADYQSVPGEISVTYAVALDDSAYWVTKDGTFLTITGTVKDGTAAGDYEVALTGISRETYDGSKVTNTEIYIGNMASDGTITNYSVTPNPGAVTVITDDQQDTSETGEQPTSEQQDTSETGGDEVSTVRGDANLDKKVDIIDVITMNRAILGMEKLEGQGLKNGDLNGDGKPTSDESLAIMKFIVGLLTEL